MTGPKFKSTTTQVIVGMPALPVLDSASLFGTRPFVGESFKRFSRTFLWIGRRFNDTTMKVVRIANAALNSVSLLELGRRLLTAAQSRRDHENGLWNASWQNQNRECRSRGVCWKPVF